MEKLFIASVFLFSLLESAYAGFDLEYGINASFLYSDVADFADFNAAITNVQNSETSTGGTRTLGLKNLAINIWASEKSSMLFVRLRPDAGLDRGLGQDAIIREIDTRSGRTYRQSARLKLLDLYELSIIKNDSFYLSYGIREKAFDPYSAFISPLDFGLEVWFPRKFSSLTLSWNTRGDKLNSLEGLVNNRYIFELFSLEPTDDRYEKSSAGNESSDTSFVSSDPHTGLAAAITYLRNSRFHYKLMAGYLDEKVDFGRKSEILGALNGIYKNTIGSYRFITSFDFRYSRESWKVSEGTFPKLEQMSLSLKGRLNLNNKDAFVLSFADGKSQQLLSSSSKEKEIHEGQQLDIGFERKVYDHLTVSLVVTDEKRTIESAGVEAGGFNFGSRSGVI